MAKVDPREFLLNTDYEMDKIIYFTEGDLTTNDAYIERSIPHKLSFTPLVFGVCAFNSDFSDPRSLPFEEVSQDNTITLDLSADSSVVKLVYTNFQTTKIYYRVYGFEPSNSKAKVGKTAGHAKDFILNTDYNYCKLYKVGTVGGNIDTTINHNLGYIPQVLAWAESSNGYITPIENNTWYNPILNQPNGIAVSTSSVTFKYSGYGANKIHYRIYYDEA